MGHPAQQVVLPDQLVQGAGRIRTASGASAGGGMKVAGSSGRSTADDRPRLR